MSHMPCLSPHTACPSSCSLPPSCAQTLKASSASPTFCPSPRLRLPCCSLTGRCGWGRGSDRTGCPVPVPEAERPRWGLEGASSQLRWPEEGSALSTHPALPAVS